MPPKVTHGAPPFQNSEAVQSKFRQEEKQIGGTDHAVVIEVGLFKAVFCAVKRAQEDQQVGGSDDLVGIHVGEARGQFVGTQKPIAIVVKALVGAVCSRENQGIGVVAIAEIGPRIVVRVLDAGALVEARFAVGQGAFRTGFLGAKCTSEVAVLDDTNNLFAKAPDARNGQFKLLNHAGLKALFAFRQASEATIG